MKLASIVQEHEVSESDEDSEALLIASARAGDHAAFESLVRLHQDRIVGQLTRMTSSADVAEELAQEVFLKAYQSLRAFRSQSKFSTWLIRIAFNTAHTYFASSAFRSRRKEIEFSTEHEARDQGATEISETRQLVTAALSQLKPKFREVVVLIAIEGFSYEQAADALQLPIGTVSSRMTTALDQMRRIISRSTQL